MLSSINYYQPSGPTRGGGGDLGHFSATHFDVAREDEGVAVDEGEGGYCHDLWDRTEVED